MEEHEASAGAECAVSDFSDFLFFVFWIQMDSLTFRFLNLFVCCFGTLAMAPCSGFV